MIKRIELSGTPPYTNGTQVIEPQKINFIFGLNGSGKTTLSRFISNPDNENYSDCSIQWEHTPIKCVVYNCDFVKENFSESSIPGIFTLGEENIENKNKIEALKNEITEINDNNNLLEIKLNGSDDTKGLNCELSDLETTFTNVFWKIKRSFDQSSLKLAFSGAIGTKADFKNKLIKEYSEIVDKLKEHEEPEDFDETEDFDELEKLCSQLFDENNEKEELIEKISFSKLVSFENNAILKKVIVGKKDVDISALIKRLGNETWVKDGVKYLGNSEGKCPFCQQDLDSDFSKKIADYFDEEYVNSINELEKCISDYQTVSNNVINKLYALLENSSQFLDKDMLLKIVQCIDKKVQENAKKLLEKKNAPNITIQFDSIDKEVKELEPIIIDTNKEINKYNERITHIDKERDILKSRVWKYVIATNIFNIKQYTEEKEKLNNSIAEVKSKLEQNKKLLKENQQELFECEKKQTSILPTVTGINNLLKNYGYNGFYIEADDSNHSYKFMRPNGKPAFESLSEGEKNFVTFLYFMYLLKGNKEESGHNFDKVVVIDDPVSSLDNDVLFIVSTLLRDMFADIYNEKGTIKQIFISSHNLYFFKEVSFNSGLKKDKTKFWMIIKNEEKSRIESFDKNPISSTYEMLWEEVRQANKKPSEISTISLGNAMRRIIEYYFKFLGGMNINAFHKQFPDGERQIFKSLISWTNAGSHAAFDDYSAIPNTYGAEKHLKVFKDLFEKTNQIAHYNLMMKSDDEDGNSE